MESSCRQRAHLQIQLAQRCTPRCIPGRTSTRLRTFFSAPGRVRRLSTSWTSFALRGFQAGFSGMRVFSPRVAEEYEWVQPISESDYDTVYQLDGTPLDRSWRPIAVRRLNYDDEGHPLRAADLPWLDRSALVLTDHALQAVGGILEGSGEFLRVDPTDGTGPLWLFNVLNVTDALDERASDLVRYPSSGRIMTVRRHAFLPDRIRGLGAFRVPQLRSLFLGGEAVDAIMAAQLSGARFDQVWADQDAP